MEGFITSGKMLATGHSICETRVGQIVKAKVQGEPKVAVVLPTYCEAENIESLVREVEELGLNLLIAVIDDSSPDGTADIVKRLQEEYDNIFLFSRPEKLGLGTAITTGFRFLLQLGDPDYIITMDADYSHNPQDMPRLIGAAKGNFDLVIGSRYYKGGKIVGLHWGRRLISRLANFIATTTIGLKVRDCTSGFRCYSRHYVETVVHNLHTQTYEIQIETLRQAQLHGFNVKEVPITFVNRKRGKSKLTAAEFRAFLTYIIKVTWGRLDLLLNQVEKRTESPRLLQQEGSGGELRDGI
ncbi:MAG: polyprenol monophosphomannose synthase [Candidatus Bathyarchaeia archaeon]